jgi:hypothetical protein
LEETIRLTEPGCPIALGVVVGGLLATGVMAM